MKFIQHTDIWSGFIVKAPCNKVQLITKDHDSCQWLLVLCLHSFSLPAESIWMTSNDKATQQWRPTHNIQIESYLLIKQSPENWQWQKHDEYTSRFVDIIYKLYLHPQGWPKFLTGKTVTITGNWSEMARSKNRLFDSVGLVFLACYRNYRK